MPVKCQENIIINFRYQMAPPDRSTFFALRKLNKKDFYIQKMID